MVFRKGGNQVTYLIFCANREETNLQVLSMPLSPVDTLEKQH